MRQFTLLSILLISFFSGFSQDFSNKGKEFWVAYPDHIDGTGSVMGLYLTSDVNATGSIDVAGTVISFTVVANTVTTKFIGPGAAGAAGNIAPYLSSQDGIKSGAGIHVTSDKPVALYAHIIRSARSGATLVLPVKVWGIDYIAPSYRNSGTSTGYGEIAIMASLPNTVVEITPAANSRNGARPAGVPFQITLVNPGDAYQLQFQSTVDLSGTRIKSVSNGVGGCKPIAVFSATTWTGMNCTNASGGDNLFQQLFPSGSWGKEFLTSPLKKVYTSGTDNNPDLVRVYVKDPATVVNKTENGVTTTLTGLTAANYYEYSSFRPTYIQATQPVEVVQYVTSQTCGTPATNSDPEMVVLSSVEQTINDITVFSAHTNFVPAGQSQVSTHYLNIIMKTNNISSFRINGAVPAASFAPIPGTAYSYLKENITTRAASNPISRLTADSGFSAIAYGFGNVESYGYNAGTNVKDLYQQIGVTSQYGIETSPSVCTGSPFRFKVSLPYIPDSMYWNFHNAPGMQPNNTNVYVDNTGNVLEDSTTIVNGKTIHWYSLPTPYTFNIVGIYPITITTHVPNGDCGSEQDIDFDLEVSDPPVAGFTWGGSGCVAEPFQFTETTPQTPKATYHFWWDFGDPASGANNSSSLRNPTHTFSAPGTYNVRFSDITTPGCLSDTLMHQVVVPALPAAAIAGTTTLCVNAPNPNVTFTATDGTAPYTFTYNINGGANQTINTGTGNSISIAVPTTTAGVFSYNLVSVNNTGSTLCTQNQSGSAVITVNPLPTAAVSGTTTVCQNAASPNITFSGAAGTAPFTFTYDINGGSTQTVTTITGNSVTVPAPTGTTGTFTYTLHNVTDASATACSQVQTGSATITIRALPTAAISGDANVCLNTVSPVITFTGSGGTAPYTFTYNINGGAAQTVTTASGNSVTIAVPTSTAGTFVYNLMNVTEAGAFTCGQSQTGSATAIVNPLPAALIAGSSTVCLNSSSPVITFTGSGSTAPYTFTYNINGGASQLVSTVSGNSVQVTVPTNAAGTFTYNLVSVADASAITCSNLQTGSAVVIVKPLPTAVIAGSAVACNNGISPLISFTGATGTAPYTFTYNINGGAAQTITTVSGNSVTVPAPTNITGTYTYNLLTVQEGSANSCSQNQTGSATVIINPLPTAAISGSTSLCLNAASPVVLFTGAGSTAPYSFSYNINGGATQTVTTITGNSISIPVPTNVAGTFNYNLVSVRDASASLCSQAQGGTAVIVVHPLPTPNFSFTVPSCETRLISFTDNSAANAGTLTNWIWSFGDPGSGANNFSNLQNPTHIFSTAGTYTVSLTDTTSNGCANAVPFTRILTINNRPLAGYILPEVCLSDTYAQFTDTSRVSAGTITGWNWNFGDANATVPNPNTSTQQNPTHSYTAVGNYNVQLVATTNTGCKDTTTQVLAINGSFPVANFTVNNPTALCANDSVSIANTSTVFPGTITKVEIYWDNVNFPAVFQTDDFPVPGKIYRHLYPNFQSPLTKTFTIRYRAYSGGVCVNDKISNITVHAAPKVQFNAIPDACLDAAPFQILQASEIGAVPGSFVFTGTGVNAAGIFSPAVAGVGTFTIKYSYTSSAAGCIDSMSRTITVLDTATANFSFVTPACEGSAASFTDLSTAPATVVLSNTVWNFGDGTPLESHAPGSTFTHIFSAWGTYQVTMYNSSSYGCRSTTTTRQVFISPSPQPAFSFAQTSVCLPNALVSVVENSTIADGTTNAFTYAWDFGDPASGTLNTSLAKNPPPHRFSGMGPYTVTLTVKSGSNCVKSISHVVNFIHPQPRADFDFSKPGVCIGDGVSMRDLSNGLDGTVNQWFWNLGDLTTSGSQNPSHTYATPLTYTVSLYVINSLGCNSDTVSKPFTVYPYPVVDAGPDRVVLQGGSITLTPTVTGNDLTYLWTPSTYIANTTSATPVAANMLEDITYRVTVTSRGGCTDFDEIFIKILKAPAIPNTFSPNGDGINEYWIIEYLDTYPDNRVQVFTRTGALVFESHGYKTPWNGTMNGKSLPIDTYYYIIEPGSGRKPITGYITILK